MLPFRPSLEELSDRIQTDIAQQLGISLPLKKAIILSALSYSLTGSLHLLHGRIDHLASQILKPEGIYLDSFANIFGVKRHINTHSFATARFKGEAGKLIEKGALLTHKSGRTYKLQDPVTIESDGHSIGKVRSELPGSTENLKKDDTLDLVESVPNIAQQVKVLDQIEPGFDTESDDELRRRLYAKLRHPGQGGTKEDYTQWAQSIPGVGRVWVSEEPKFLQIFLTFLTTDRDYPIPTERHLNEVTESIRKRKPLGTIVSIYKLEPVPISIELELTGDLVRHTPKIEIALKDYFLKWVDPSKNVTPFGISQVISRTIPFGRVKVTSPAQDVEIKQDHIATFGGLKWKTTQLL